MFRRRTWLCGVLACALWACSDREDGETASASSAGSAPSGAAGAGAGSLVAGTFSGGAGTGELAAGAPGPSSGGVGAVAGERAPRAGRGSRGGEGPATAGRVASDGGSIGSAAAGGAAAGDSGSRGPAAGGAAAGTGSDAGAAGAAAQCPYRGAITYELARNAMPSAAERAAYDKISAAMDRALEIYNCYTDFNWKVRVSYVPSVQTADGNTNGSIRFGSNDSMNYITAMHETSHTLGVGGSQFQSLIVNGIFTGPQATQALRGLSGDPSAELHGDSQHFWPYGLNYTSEVKGMEDLIRHCTIMIAMRRDLGL